MSPPRSQPKQNQDCSCSLTPKLGVFSSWKGQTIQVYLVGTEDSSLQTSFVVDDFALNVQ